MCDICKRATRKCRPRTTKLHGSISGRIFFEALNKKNLDPAIKFEWNNAEYYHSLTMKIKFCPFCGEELKKED